MPLAGRLAFESINLDWLRNWCTGLPRQTRATIRKHRLSVYDQQPEAIHYFNKPEHHLPRLLGAPLKTSPTSTYSPLAATHHSP